MRRFSAATILGSAALVFAAACSDSPIGTDPSVKPLLGVQIVPAGGTIDQSNITAGACSATEWHWVINGLASETLAPASIVAHFNTGDVVVPKDKFTGGTAHYTWTANLGDQLEAPYATANLAAGTHYLRFNLSHGPCDGGDTPQGSSVVTEVRSADNVVLTNDNPAGLAVRAHDVATVDVTGGFAIPGGSFVSFYFWTNNSCDGTPAAGPEDVNISGTPPQSVNSSVQGPLGAGEYSFKALFTSGDPDKVSDSEGECEKFKVSRADVTTSTNVHNATHQNITNGSVVVGSYVHDNATVGPPVTGFPIGGTVTFRFYTNGTCTGEGFTSETVAVGSESTAQQIAAAGNYAYSAKYDGDDNYNPSDGSDCEPFTVYQLGKTMGFWGNTNGIARIIAGGGYAANAVNIGRGANVDTQGESAKILPNTLNACGKGTPFIFTIGAQTASAACTLATGINVGTLNTNSSQTLALGYNIKLVSGYTGQTIGALLCSASVTAGLTSTSTVNQAFAAAVGLINGSATGGTTTQGQLGAMNSLLGCLNREL